MIKHVKARDYFITLSQENGVCLAETLLDLNVNWKGFVINLAGINEQLFTKPFFEEFIKTLQKEAPLLMGDIENIIWVWNSSEKESQIYEWVDSIIASFSEP
jgi:hypothetical protein